MGEFPPNDSGPEASRFTAEINALYWHRWLSRWELKGFLPASQRSASAAADWGLCFFSTPQLIPLTHSVLFLYIPTGNGGYTFPVVQYQVHDVPALWARDSTRGRRQCWNKPAVHFNLTVGLKQQTSVLTKGIEKSRYLDGEYSETWRTHNF